jgi:hypothetical protein
MYQTWQTVPAETIQTPDKVVYDGPGNVPDLTFIAIATFAGLPRPRRRFDVDRVTPDWWM